MRGDGGIFRQKASRFWWIRYSLNGRQFRESTGCEDEKQARKYLKRRLKEVGAAQIGLARFITPSQQKITVAELMDGLKSDYEMRAKWNARVRSHVKALKASLGHFRAVELTKKPIDCYVRERQQAGRTSATINIELQLIGQAYKIGEVGSGPHIQRLPVNNAREGYFEKADFETLIKELPQDLRDYVRFAYLIGWRKGEISSLRWSELDMEGRTLRLRHAESKNGDARSIPLQGELWELIKRRWETRVYRRKNGETILSGFVFHRRGKPVGDFEKSWDNAREKANLPGKLFHDFRRTASRNMRRAGVPEEIAMMITGHRTSSMFRRYNITNEEDLKKAVLMMQDYVSTLPTERQNVVQFPQKQGEGIENKQRTSIVDHFSVQKPAQAQS